ncbi:hypothetical protein GRAN_0825 [Granulicella sibirica]|uniref:Outer membrane protein beta-barrel domain-containing protein n=2 Tax=Granulicella sibirica TaxID=2479048 RepID=A0A4Q0T1J8_9BACT|nr:hypothetical protein GRAN_0825 [Granulicella sibirica]
MMCGLALGALCIVGQTRADAQAQVVTAFDRQLSRLDLAVSGAGYFNTKTSGNNYLGQPLVNDPGNTLGAIVTIRYTARPYVGFEFNYGYARFTQNFSSIGGVQSNANEYTVGYVAHPGFSVFGLQPFAAIGAGSIANKPTPGGGQGLQEQARAAYYYGVGVDDLYFGPHFGFRGQFRQLISLAPDYGQNYLTIKKRTITSEPAFGIFLKF